MVPLQTVTLCLFFVVGGGGLARSAERASACGEVGKGCVLSLLLGLASGFPFRSPCSIHGNSRSSQLTGSTMEERAGVAAADLGAAGRLIKKKKSFLR